MTSEVLPSHYIPLASKLPLYIRSIYHVRSPLSQQSPQYMRGEPPSPQCVFTSPSLPDHGDLSSISDPEKTGSHACGTPGKPKWRPSQSSKDLGHVKRFPLPSLGRMGWERCSCRYENGKREMWRKEWAWGATESQD